MPYCLYVRKSRADAEAEARGEGETLSRHINALLELAKRRNLQINQIYKEIVSGETIAARPVMQKLLTEVEQRLWEGVLVMEVERLARGDTIDQGIMSQTFKISGTKIITPLKDYDPNNEFDEEYFEFGLFMSRREYKTINRRLQRGRLASVKEGKYVGNKPPYGYKRIKLEHDKGFTLAPDPKEADVVKLIFALYTVGDKQEDGSYERLGVAKIARKLNNLNITPRISKDWSTATIRDMLKNPVYIGKVRWNRRPAVKSIENGQVSHMRIRNVVANHTVVDGLHPSLISEDTFNKAQEYLKLNPPRPIGEKNKVQNPLSGLVFCSECGHSMVRRPYSNRKQADTLLCQNTACKNVSTPLYLVENSILDALEQWAKKYSMAWEKKENTNTETSALKAKEKAFSNLEKEYDTLHKQLNTTHDLLEQGVYDTDTFLLRSRDISNRIKNNEENRQKLHKEIEKERLEEISRIEFVPKVKNILEVYGTLNSAKAKNDLLKEVIKKVVYTKKNKSKKGSKLEPFEITLYPRIPLP